MLLCSYENHTGKTINPKELEDGSVQLKDLLTEEDFKMARSVIIFLFFIINYHVNKCQCSATVFSLLVIT